MEEAVKQLLKIYSSGNDNFLESEVVSLAARFGESTYKELLLQLTGKNFGTSKSKQYWQEALSHRDSIEKGFPRRLGIRTALFDLLSNKFNEFSNPVFVEADYLENIRLSSITDGLTGLYNQTHFKSLLNQSLLPHGRRSNDNTSALLLLDLDHFKHYNDRCGHLAGDEALRVVGRIIQDQIREYDVAARYGGEEFAVYLPNTTKAEATVVAERIRSAVEAFVIPGQQLLDSKNLTISGGVAAFPSEADDAKSLILLADRELYKAKQRRNSISPTNYERRKNQRHNIPSVLEFSLINLPVMETAIVHDISSSGVGIWSNRPVSPDEQMYLRFLKPFWKDNMEIRGLVRQIYFVKETELHYLGVEFEQHLDDCTRFLQKRLVRKSVTH